MSRKVVQIVSALGLAAVVAALLAFLPGGVARNYEAYHGEDARVVTSDAAAAARYDIDVTVTSGLRVRLPRVSRDDYLSLSLGADDTYKAAFSLDGEAVGSFVIDSGAWAPITDAAGLKPIRHLIPAYIVREGYDEITLSPLRGDGAYTVAYVATETAGGAARTLQANVIDFEIKQLEIEVREKNFRELEQKREDALRVGILLTYDSDVVPARMIADGKKYDVDVRLKGDWTDHLRGDQWSMRIEIDGNNALWGMEKFSVQPPATRNWIHEYMIYAFYREQGGVALRYDFLDVYVNGEYKGVFALEEFMEKRVIEHSRKRESAIVRWDEHIYPWERRAVFDNEVATGYAPKLLDENRAEDANALLGVFSPKKTLEVPTLTGYAQYAIDMLNRVWAGQLAAAEVFDAELFAKYYIILDIFRASHGQVLHNIRNYYNPITGRLEPIPFDELAGGSTTLTMDGNSERARLLFDDPDFEALYLRYIDKVTDDFQAFLVSHEEDLRRKAEVIRRDNYDFGEPYNADFLSGNIAALKDLDDLASRAAPTVEYKDGALTVTNNDSTSITITAITNGGHALAADKLPLTISNKDSGGGTVLIPIAAHRAAGLQITYAYQFIDRTYHADARIFDYGFYAVGHFYGEGVEDAARHPSPAFVGYTPALAADPDMAFGVIMGDIVTTPTDEAYQRAVGVLQSTGHDYHALPGNHDESDGGALFEKYLGDKHRAFAYGDNLFILLDSRMEENGIARDGAQADMIRAALTENPDAKNIFVFTHELIWLDENDARFGGFTSNMGHNPPEILHNFQNFLLPLLRTTGTNLYFIAGDSGKWANGNEIFYGEHDGVTYIATGLGSGTHDNLLRFNLFRGGEVGIDLVALNGDDPDALGRIADYARGGGP